MMKRSSFSRTVWLLGWISLLADISSELLYPVLPVYLREAGYSMLALGLLEGVANVVAGVSKGYFGQRSDLTGNRHHYVRWGYGLSALGKLLMLGMPGLFRIYAGRITDRLGKGIRTAPRDALLAAEATADTGGAVFGFHRSMDTFGAAIGPAIALAWLYVYPGDYGTIFLLAFLPALLSLLVTFLVKDTSTVAPAAPTVRRPGFFAYFRYWTTAAGQYRALLRPLFLLSLVSAPETFLLLAVKETGATDVLMITLYIVFNLLYAIFAAPVGRLADRIGKKKVLAAGMVLFAITYAGMSMWTGTATFFLLFSSYALALSAMESVVKAIIAAQVDPGERGQALGLYASGSSIGILLAGAWSGLLWKYTGPATVFLITAVVAAIAVTWLFITVRTPAAVHRAAK